MRFFTLLTVAFMATVSVYGQTGAVPDSPPPAWIAMMDDPKVNYHEAVRAFEAYWKDKPLPAQEHERLSSEDPASFRAEPADPDMAFACKRFRRWMIRMEPFVKPDGTLMSPDERVEQWKRQRQNRR